MAGIGRPAPFASLVLRARAAPRRVAKAGRRAGCGGERRMCGWVQGSGALPGLGFVSCAVFGRSGCSVLLQRAVAPSASDLHASSIAYNVYRRCVAGTARPRGPENRICPDRVSVHICLQLIPVRRPAPVDSTSVAAASASDCGGGGTPLAAVYVRPDAGSGGLARDAGLAGWRVSLNPSGCPPTRAQPAAGSPSLPAAAVEFDYDNRARPPDALALHDLNARP